MIGCSRCGHLHEVCECADVGTIGENRDMFEKEVNATLEKEIILQKTMTSDSDWVDLGSHYRNEFKGVKIDVYRVLQIFGVTDPVAQHIVKKLLRGTKKGHDEMTVWNEVFQACERKKEMLEEDK